MKYPALFYSITCKQFRISAFTFPKLILKNHHWEISGVSKKISKTNAKRIRLWGKKTIQHCLPLFYMWGQQLRRGSQNPRSALWPGIKIALGHENIHLRQ